MRHFEKYFLWSVIVILTLTALAKLISASDSARILNHPDPVFVLPNRAVLLGVSAVELTLVAFLLSGANPATKYILIIWLSVNFMIYRIGLVQSAHVQLCPCLGRIAEHLPFKETTIDTTLRIITGYLFIGGALLLAQTSLSLRRSRLVHVRAD